MCVVGHGPVVEALTGINPNRCVATAQKGVWRWAYVAMRCDGMYTSEPRARHTCNMPICAALHALGLAGCGVRRMPDSLVRGQAHWASVLRAFSLLGGFWA